MTNFTRDYFDLSSMFTTGSHVTINYKVKGFWSTSALTLYVKVEQNWKTETYEVSVDISRSSGGRDTDEEASESISARNYAMALLDAAELADLFKASEHHLVENYKSYLAQVRAEREAEQAKKAAKIDSDSHIKSYEAVWIADDMKAEADRNNQAIRKFRMRGMDKTVTIHCMNYGKTRYYIGQQAVSRKEAVNHIATMAEEIK